MRTIKAEDIRQCISIEDLFEPLREAFKIFAKGADADRNSDISMLHFPQGADAHIKSAHLPGYPFFTVKIVNSFVTEKGRCSDGIIAVFDSKTGKPVTILKDNGYLTDIRTAAMGALVTNYFSNPEASMLGIIGTGTQARLQGEAMLMIRDLQQINIWGKNIVKACLLKEHLETLSHGTIIKVYNSVERLMIDSQMIITTTASKQSIIKTESLKPGHHITALGADDLFKKEIHPGVFLQADKIFVDSVKAVKQVGELSDLLKASLLPFSSITEIGDVFNGVEKGRTDRNEITIAKLVGIGIQDMVAANMVMEKMGLAEFTPY